MKVIKIGENGYFLDLDDALDRFRFKAKHYTGAWLYAHIGPNCHGNWDLWWETDSYSATSSDLIQDTLCQCTGAKDSKGNLIYENDIIQRKDGGVVTNEYLVVYNPNTFNYKVKGKGETDWSDFSFIPLWLSHGVELVVIGNKFDDEGEEDEEEMGS